MNGRRDFGFIGAKAVAAGINYMNLGEAYSYVEQGNWYAALSALAEEQDMKKQMFHRSAGKALLVKAIAGSRVKLAELGKTDFYLV